MDGSTIAAAESSSHIKLSTEYSVRYRATGVSDLALDALISGPHYYFPGILMHHANNEVGGGFVEWLGVWRTLDQRRDYIRLVIPGPECRRRARRPIGKIAPAALIAELAIESFPAFAFFFGVKQRKLSALDNRNVGAPSNFQQPERALGFLFHPLVAADGSDAQDVESIRLEKDQNRLHVGRSRPTRIL